MPPITPETDPLYTVEQIADFLNMKPRFWRHVFDTRAVPLVKLGRRLYIRRSTALAYVDAHTISARETEAGVCVK